jgi:branched-chain amino acid transport system permease protein
MSASQWRKAMNSGSRALASAPSSWSSRPAGMMAPSFGATTSPAALPPQAGATGGPAVVAERRRSLLRQLLVIGALLLYPWVATPFFTFQIGGQTLALGIIALSLTFLAGYGGMVSLAQMTIAGSAGYAMAIFGHSAATQISLGWPWWLAVLLALLLATLFATFIGWLSVRTEGIYTIMITLAIGVAFYYLVQQNYTIFNGFQGFSKILPPEVFGLDWRAATPFYYLALASALAAYYFIRYLIRAPFGIALQGIRDNPRRMNSLGFNVNAHRIAAYAVAGFIAAVGGVLLTWYNSLVTPGVVGVTALINVLIISVLGGIGHPIAAFIGALVFVLLQNFAIDLVDRERFNLVIGTIFLLIVLFSPDGLLGLWRRYVRRVFAGDGRDRLGREKPSA